MFTLALIFGLSAGKLFWLLIAIGVLAYFAIAYAPAMAYDPNELYKPTSDFPQTGWRIDPRHIEPKTFASGTGTIKKRTPVSFNTATQKWVVWSFAGAGVNQVDRITVDATGGNITIGVTPPNTSIETTGNISATATAVTMQAALLALGNLLPGDVVVTGGPGNSGGTTPYTLTWGGQYKNQAITVAVTGVSLTGGGSTVTKTNLTAAAAGTGADKFKGILYPDDLVLVSGFEVIGNVMTEGTFNFNDLLLPAGEDINNLKAAVRRDAKFNNFIVQGLDAVA